MSREARNALIAVVVVVAAWAVGALTLAPLQRWFAWDEAVYFAKASPKFPTITWAAERDIGFPAVLWPVISAGGGLVAARVELVVLCALGAVTAYATWVGAIGAAAPAAALLFLSSWPALFYGSELYPHMIVAVAIVGAFGAAANAVRKQATGPALLALGLSAFAACIRPSDVLLAVAAAVPVLFALERGRATRAIAALVGGAVIGCVGWIVEAFAVFDNPVARWREAFGNTPARDPRRGVLLGLAHRGLRTDLFAAPVVAALVWVVALAALMVAGVIIARRRGHLVAVLPPAVAGVLIVTAYAVYWSDTGARFLIPGFALASVPAGVAVHAAWRAVTRAPGTRYGMAGGVVCAAVVVAVVVHAHATSAIGAHERAVRALDRATGMEMAVLAAGRPCRFVAQFGYPAIELASGCDGSPGEYDVSASLTRAFRSPRGWVRFAVGPNPPVAGSRIAHWQLLSVPGAPGVRLYAGPEVRSASTAARTPPG